MLILEEVAQEKQLKHVMHADVGADREEAIHQVIHGDSIILCGPLSYYKYHGIPDRAKILALIPSGKCAAKQLWHTLYPAIPACCSTIPASFI